MTTKIDAERRSVADLDDHAPPETRQRASPADVDQTTRYRYLIASVEEFQSTVTLDQLVDVMLQWEMALSDEECQKTWHDIHEELYLVDLPTLDRAGFVEFDTTTGIVRTTAE